MTSNINVNNIITTFPIPGQDNDSQGFRDNFTNIKISLINAKAEIEDLQSKALLKNPLIGTALNNNMAGSSINSAEIFDFRETQIDYGTAAGTIILDHSRAHYHSINTFGDVRIGFNKLPPSGTVGRIRLKLHVNSTSHRLVLPTQVTTGLEHLVGYDPVTRKVFFARTGVCLFEFLTDDNGYTFNIQDMTRGNAPILEPASRDVLGFVKVGTGLSVTTEGLISANSIANATTTSLGLVQAGEKLMIIDGVLSVDPDIGLITSGEFNGRIGHTTPHPGYFTDVNITGQFSLGNSETSSESEFFLNSRETFSYSELVLNNENVQNLVAVSNNSGETRFGIPTGTVGIGGNASVPLVFAVNSTEYMRMDANGNVGIGTTDPIANLHINEGSFRMTGIDNDPMIQLGNTYGNGYSFVYDVMMDSLSINYDFPLGTPYESLLTVTSMGDIGIGNTMPDSKLVIGGNLTINNMDSTSGVTLYSDINNQLSVKGDFYNDGNLFALGNVGVGTDMPTSKFEVYQPGNVFTKITSNTTGYSSQVQFNRGEGMDSYIGPNYNDIFAIATDEDIPIVFYGMDNTELMRIDNTGNVNIGGLNPVIDEYRYLDIVNAGENQNGSSLRLISTDQYNVGFASLELKKDKSGQASIINNDSRVEANISFKVGQTVGTDNMIIDSTGNVNILGNLIVGSSLIDNIGNVRDLSVVDSSSPYTLSANDDSKLISMTTGGITVPTDVFTVGKTVTIFNNSSSSQTIVQGSGVTMFKVGTSSTGDRTLSQRGLAVLICVDTDTFVISGGGLS